MDEWQDAAQRAVEAIEELIALQDEYQENLYSRSGIIAHRSGRFGIHKVYFPSLAAAVGLVHETESIPLAILLVWCTDPRFGFRASNPVALL